MSKKKKKQQKRNWWLQAGQRWFDETPLFWKKVRTWMVGIGGSAIALIGFDKMFDLQAYGVDPRVFTIASYIIVFCAAVGLSAQITHNNKDDDDTN